MRFNQKNLKSTILTILISLLLLEFPSFIYAQQINAILEDDLKGEEEIKTRIVPLVYITDDDVRSILEEFKTPNGKIIFNQDTKTFILRDVPKVLDEMEQIIKELDVPVETKEFVLKFIKADEISADIKKILSKEAGHLEVNTEKNSLVVTDRLLKLQEVERLIQNLDLVGKKVQMDVKILQIILSDEHKLGIDWEAIVSKYQRLNFAAFDTARILPKEKEVLSLGSITTEDAIILTEALETVGEMKTVVVDQVVTQNQNDVKILIPIKAVSSFEGNISSEGYPVMLGDVKLTLTPQIKGDETINVEIKPSFFVMSDDAPKKPRKNILMRSVAKGADLIWSATRVIPGMGEQAEEELTLDDLKEQASVENSVMEIQDGATIVIGGMIKEVLVKALIR